MPLPLPKVVADMEAGGPLVTSNMGVNALRAKEIENQINQVKARYAPLTAQADAASKLAYANLMGPQFLAKLMANDPILANMSKTQKDEALKKLYQAGTGQGTGNAFVNQYSTPNTVTPVNGANQGKGFSYDPNTGVGENALRWIFNKATGSVNNQSQNAMNQPTQPQNAMINMPNVGRGVNATPDQAAAINNLQPGGSVTIDANGNPISSETPYEEKGTFAERTGKYKSLIKEGEETGTIRAKDIDQFGKDYETAQTRGYAYDSLTDLMNSPTFQNMRSKVPFFQDKQLKVLSKIGTPEEQELIGQFIGSAGELVRQTINSFEGNKLRGEVSTAREMKISNNDTYNVMMGKLESGMKYNEFNKQRAALTANIMKTQHLDKQKALEIADKQLNGKQIRQDIHDKLNPTITIRNKKTGKMMTLPVKEARSRYGVNI